MNVLDIVITIALAFLIVRGLMRGFIKEIASLVGVILGIVLAIQFEPLLSSFLSSFFPSLRILPLISFGVIFFTTLIVCNILGWLFRWVFKKIQLGWADRALGVGLALIKGVIIAYLIIVLLTIFLPTGTPLIARSRLAPKVITSYQYMVRLISPEYYEKLKRTVLQKKKEVGVFVQDRISDTEKEK